MIDLLSCSIAVEKVQPDKKVGKVIQFFERLGDRPNRLNPFKLGEAWHCHALILENRRQLIETHILQGVRKRPLGIYAPGEIEIFRPLFLNEVTIYNMVTIANYLIGQKYGSGKLPLHALDAIFATYWFTNRIGITSFMDCSNLVGWLYKHAPTVEVDDLVLYGIAMGKIDHPDELGYELGCKWQSLNPDKLFDFVTVSSEWICTKI
jgi:hypothetical protein